MSLAIPSNFANAVTPFAPVGRQPVGQETVESRDSTLKPLEQLPESARLENRRSPDDRPSETGERQRLSRNSSESSTRTAEADSPVAEDQNALEQQQERLEELKTQQEIRELASRDREVRLHEQAHAAIGGRHAGAPQYDYERGPDGVNYAVSGEVPINTSKVPNDPQATIEKAQQIRRAAYAPAEPSDTDRRVAAAAAQMEAQARVELRQESLQESAGESDSRPGQTQADIAQGDTADTGVAKEGTIKEDTTAKENTAKEGAAQGYMAQKYVDSYRQLVDVGALSEQSALGSRLNQRA